MTSDTEDAKKESATAVKVNGTLGGSKKTVVSTMKKKVDDVLGVKKLGDDNTVDSTTVVKNESTSDEDATVVKHIYDASQGMKVLTKSDSLE